MEEVPISVQRLERFAPLVGDAPVKALVGEAERLRALLGEGTIWNVSSTARGGGVAELLRTLVAYARGAGLNARWMVINAPPDFFQLTKRLHHLLHGSPGDGGPLGEAERPIYEKPLEENARAFVQLVRPRDVVLLHDPQTAGMIPALVKVGARVLWRCHIGADRPNAETARGWAFLAPYLGPAHHYVFSRAAYIPDGLDRARTTVIVPTINPFSAKNERMPDEDARAILVHIGVIEGPPGPGRRMFCRDDGTPARVEHCADLVRMGRSPTADVPLVVQVSRWDRLKDPLGVMRGFSRLLEPTAPREAQLLLVGPNVRAVADDPEGSGVFEEVICAWRALPHVQRGSICLVNLPMTDVEENAAMVNALQRHAAVVVQKSLLEGFGLTVTEAMWKGRPVIASAVGGIVDQIEDGVSGLLLRDPRDPDAFAALLRRVLTDSALAERLGAAAEARVKSRFLGFHSLAIYSRVVAKLATL